MSSYWNCNICGLSACVHTTNNYHPIIHNLTDRLVTITGNGTFQFQVKEKMVPSGSIFYFLNDGRFSNKVILPTGEIKLLPKDTIHLPFSDGILNLIYSFFFKEVEKKGVQYLDYRMNYEWPNPTVAMNIRSFVSITQDDLDVLSYHQVVVSKIGVDLQCQIKLLPRFGGKMYPTMLFIQTLAEYLGLPSTIEKTDGQSPVAKTFSQDIRIVSKCVRSTLLPKEERKNISIFLQAIRWKISTINKLNIEIDTEYSKLTTIDFNILGNHKIMELTFQSVQLLYSFFDLLNKIKKSSESEIFRSIRDDELKNAVYDCEKIRRKYDQHYVYVVESMYRLYNFYFDDEASHVEPRIHKHHSVKTCKCSRSIRFNTGRTFGDFVQFFESTYNGCSCVKRNYSWLR